MTFYVHIILNIFVMLRENTGNQATEHIQKYFKTVVFVQHMKIFIPSHHVKTYVRKQDAKQEKKKYIL